MRAPIAFAVSDVFLGTVLNCTQDPGPSASGSHPFGKFAFVAPGSTASVPAEAVRIELHSRKAKLLGRVELKTDLGGRVVIPGVIDAHNHPVGAGIPHLFSVDCALPSISDIPAALRERADKTPPEGWATGFKFDDTKTAERRNLTRADLDAVSTSHPVLVEHRGGHTALVNSLARASPRCRDASRPPASPRPPRPRATPRRSSPARMPAMRGTCARASTATSTSRFWTK